MVAMRLANLPWGPRSSRLIFLGRRGDLPSAAPRSSSTWAPRLPDPRPIERDPPETKAISPRISWAGSATGTSWPVADRHALHPTAHARRKPRGQHTATRADISITASRSTTSSGAQTE
jgi:hypothetical protein